MNMHEFGIIIQSNRDRINMESDNGSLGEGRGPGYKNRMEFSDAAWRAEMASMIRDAASLPEAYRAAARKLMGNGVEEGGDGAGTAGPALRVPFGITPYYLSLAEPREDDPILRQCLPSAAESRLLPYESSDPLGALEYEAGPRLVRQYRSRALLLANGACAGYCRFCFRSSFAGEGFISDADAERAAAYLRDRHEIAELLVSGGDPCAASDEKIGSLLGRLREARPDLALRLCTRTPVTLPSRFTDSFLSLLRGLRPIWIVTHFNHPRELSPFARAALARIADAGLPVLNQTVLLRGVNDSAPVLAELCEGLLRAGAKPYYLLQGDLAAGTAHFRTGLAESLDLYGALIGTVSGAALPAFALDLPRGGGKRRLLPDSPLVLEGGFYRFESADGRPCPYPAEEPPA